MVAFAYLPVENFFEQQSVLVASIEYITRLGRNYWRRIGVAAAAGKKQH